MKANVVPLKSIEMYFKQNAMGAKNPIRLTDKTNNVCATIKALFGWDFDGSSAEHMQSHVINRRIVTNGCIFSVSSKLIIYSRNVVNSFNCFRVQTAQNESCQLTERAFVLARLFISN